MSISAGSVSLSESSPTVVYETPAGVETTLVVQVAETYDNDAYFGQSDVSSTTGIVLNNQSPPLTLTGFTGTLYGLASSGSTSAVYLAADLR